MSELKPPPVESGPAAPGPASREDCSGAGGGRARIVIVGAGITGCALAQCLLRRGVRCVLYEKASARPRFNYALDLSVSVLKRFLTLLGISETDFLQRCAVAQDDVHTDRERPSMQGDSRRTSIHVNRSKFEALLREGLDIRWEHELIDIEECSKDCGEGCGKECVCGGGERGGGGRTRSLRLHFQTPQSEKIQRVETAFVVAADGIHSKVRAKILPEVTPTILPYVAVNGRHFMSSSDFAQLCKHLQEGNNTATQILTQAPESQKHIRLEACVYDKSSEQVGISYTYARPAKSDPPTNCVSDPLFRPHRSLAEATDIPPDFYVEVASLSARFKPPFGELFRPENMRKDRLLLWLIRSLLVPEERLHEALDKGVAFLGDACHHVPIIRGRGGAQALEDALRLSALLTTGPKEAPTEVVRAFYKSMYDVWVTHVKTGVKNFENFNQESEVGRPHFSPNESIPKP